MIQVPPLAGAEVDAVLQHMLAEIAESLGLSFAPMTDDALRRLRSAGLRRSRMALGLAIGVAVEMDRQTLEPGDIEGALDLLGDGARPPPRQAIGFRLAAEQG